MGTAGSQQHATPTRSWSSSSDDRIENKAITTRIIRRWWPQKVSLSSSEARQDQQQRNLDPFLIRPTTVAATLPTRTQTAPLASPTITATRRTTPVMATGTATATRNTRPITTIVGRRRRYGRRSRRLGRRTNGIVATQTTLQ